MEVALLASIVQGGCLALVSWIVWYVFSRMIPKLIDNFRDEARLERESHQETTLRIATSFETAVGNVTELIHRMYLKEEDPHDHQSEKRDPPGGRQQ